MKMGKEAKKAWDQLEEIVQNSCPDAAPQVQAQYARGLYGAILARLASQDWIIRDEIQRRLEQSRDRRRS
jgi:hypothetical protein